MNSGMTGTTESPVWSVTLEPLMEAQEVQEKWLIDNLIPAEGMTLISGQPESGKTTLAANLTRSLLTREPLGDDQRFGVHDPGNGEPHHKVMWLGFDGGWMSSLQRLIGRLDIPKVAVDRLLIGRGFDDILRFDPDNVEHARRNWDAFADMLRMEGVTAIIVDHLYELSGGCDVSNPRDMSPVLSALSKIERAGIAPIVLHHASSHGTSGKPMGSTTIVAHRRCGLEVVTMAKATRVDVRANDAPRMSLMLEPLAGGLAQVRGLKPHAGPGVGPPLRVRGSRSATVARPQSTWRKQSWPLPRRHVRTPQRPVSTSQNRDSSKVALTAART